MKEASSPLSDPRRNLLLAGLPGAEWERWRPTLEPVSLAAGQVLCESGSTPSHLVFPTTAIVSLMYMTRDGGSAELAAIGNEGLVGIALFMGGNGTPSQAVVQSAGLAWRLGAHAVRREVDRAGPVLAMLLRYTQAMIAQVAQTAVCNRYHSIDQQLARRLLLGLDRSESDDLTMTQEGAANLLGVRREGITAAALKLQQAGVIRYSRGHIAVLDRARLEHCTCECYGAAKREYERLLPAAVTRAPRPQPIRIAVPAMPTPIPARVHKPRPIPAAMPLRMPPTWPAPMPMAA